MPWRKKWRSSLSAVWVLCCFLVMLLRQILFTLLATGAPVGTTLYAFTSLNVILFLGESIRGTLFFAFVELASLKNMYEAIVRPKDPE